MALHEKKTSARAGSFKNWNAFLDDTLALVSGEHPLRAR
jgi:hypothetical protein